MYPGQLMRPLDRGLIGRVLATAVTLASLVAPLAAPATAAEPGEVRSQSGAEAETASPSGRSAALAALAHELGLSLFGSASDATLRVPLAARGEMPVGKIQPYAAISPRLSPAEADAVVAGFPSRDLSPSTAPSVDMGAGLSWHLTDRVDLFGQYRLLLLRPAPADSVGGRPAKRDAEEPALRGGFSVRF